VEVTAADGTRASAEGCVTVLDTGGPPPGEGALPKPQPSLSVVETGPSRRNVGQTAEFSIAITNTGGQDLTNLKVVDRFDPGLTPTLASPGHQRANDDLTWTIPKLAAGETTRLTAQFECRTPSQRLCNRVTVTSQEGARGEAEACLEVRAAAPAAGPSRLTLTVFGSWNPVYAGRPVTYWVRVENKGLTAERRVRIAATVPAGLAPDATPGPLATGGPPGTSYSIEGQTIRFTPLTEIRPGDSATYYVRVRTPEAGSYTMRFELQSEDQPQPIVREESIRVLAPRSGG
jgi:uncharacterized repeat protein (TIGR01451 family)